jgi:hypothetical protein
LSTNPLEENWVGVCLEGLGIENLSSHWLMASAIFEGITTREGGLLQSLTAFCHCLTAKETHVKPLSEYQFSAGR